ncbi:FkbM family methyltransferase [Bradyrhizobium diazoefficiens]|nr:FkbM family methyltransferase [Bradyrhizobium diazoefficiens]MBR1013185.1 FkbM family methyltransferase [Bradyrhizobium diazoefficiens]MBR1050004.1 FkbM family methyltransferase [Bradyrhizobium diazoefficiens]MBR1107676.1 FkbM family methyltransferase [Bradyrhizobium diazoefficiens]MBR1114291.1 FkbM family methyltransferase [Bradyrhizobium diazoefficiens]
MKSRLRKILFEVARHAAARLTPSDRRALVLRLLNDKSLTRPHRFELLSELARTLDITRVSARGDCGTISGSPEDAMIFQHYVLYGTWAGTVNETLQSFFSDGRGSYLDIGANIGLTLVPLARRHPAIICHAFEPEPASHDNLALNVAENCSASNVVLHRFALHDRAGMMPFEIAKRNLGDHRLHAKSSLPTDEEETGRRLIEVPCKRLDDLALELSEPLFVKIDVQGAEPFVIDGGKATLAAATAMIVEWSPYHMACLGADSGKLLAFMTENFRWGVIHENEAEGLSLKGHIKPVTDWLRNTLPAWIDTRQHADVLVSKSFPG